MPKINKPLKLDKIIPLKNPDKKLHETYYDGRNVADIPKPFVFVANGRPNSGKSLMTLHIIAACQSGENPFDEIYIVHGAANQTKEYEIVDPTDIFEEIPKYSDFDPEKNTLVIFDDVDYSKVSKADLKKISELVRFGASHFNISQIYLNQNFFRIPRVLRDNALNFIIFKPNDTDELSCIGRRIGIDKKTIKLLFREQLSHFRDSLFVDLKPGAPHKYYKNLFEVLDVPED